MVLLAAIPPIVVSLLMLALFVVSLFLILLVLVQRGKGGGLTGALGGMGGQSAFGSKAGDVFTRITIITAVVWILLCLLTIQILGPDRSATATENGLTVEAGAGAGEDESSSGVRLLSDDEAANETGAASSDDPATDDPATEDSATKKSATGGAGQAEESAEAEE